MAQTVTPLPAIGDVIAGQDVAGRELRISGHPDSDRLVLSIWQSGRCLATVRLARADVPEVTRALVAGLVPLPSEPSSGPDLPDAEPGTVHQLRPPVAGRLHQVSTRLGSAVGTRIGSAVTSRLPGGLSGWLRRPGPHD
jgi:hypothetical protein